MQPQEQPQQPQLESVTLTTPQLAKYLNVSERTIYKMAAAGEIPGRVKFLNALRWNKQVIDEWVQKGATA